MENDKRGRMVAEYIDYREAYRIYHENTPNDTVAYVSEESISLLDDSITVIM